ncbi:MAG: hypothetical protein KME03_03435 [Aphanocapsa lilacina HA4352-LM1]|jgi:hypothetical protein|uniref:Uncharacterized protein n=1 Tax=Gloeobacter morelensis MG652769 TaxID=2781736 RepID=A0ABY3PJG3_9CYAN|nr:MULTISPECIES: hypothetical protein [Gloeobacter]MBW4696950.1 hypothetical protein [Aphanocapsa lilacina HA4352-LM1]UFP93795.1 hypothetical protein ISF26_18755 [Gloeobacter morelensis MG652769]
MSKPAHEHQKPANFGEAVRLHFAELLGFVLLIALAAFTVLNKMYYLI